MTMPALSGEAQAVLRKSYVNLDYVEDLELLVKWLAMPYGDNSPIFAKKLPNGDALETGILLEDLYRRVVGDKRPTAGHWEQCPTCEMWQVRTPELPINPDVLRTPDEILADKKARAAAATGLQPSGNP